jgi:hypothetical protein
VFDALLEIDRVLNASAALGPTERIIERVMHNDTDSCGRQNLRMVAETNKLRMSRSGEVGTASFLAEDFRWNVAHELAEPMNQPNQSCKDIADSFLDLAVQSTLADKASPSPQHPAT